jgi:hypothetical protein
MPIPLISCDYGATRDEEHRGARLLDRILKNPPTCHAAHAFSLHACNLQEVLHADWPVYPGGHGWIVALKSLAVFPPNVRFLQISDIDQCLLLVAVGSGSCLEPKGDLFDPKWFHVAVWRDDLRELHERGLISGVSLVTEYEVAQKYYERNKDLYVEIDGKLRGLDLPHPQRDDYDEDQPSVAQIGQHAIPLHAPELVRPVGIVHRKRKKFNRAAQSFLELLQEAPDRAPVPQPVG